MKLRTALGPSLELFLTFQSGGAPSESILHPRPVTTTTTTEPVSKNHHPSQLGSRHQFKCGHGNKEACFATFNLPQQCRRTGCNACNAWYRAHASTVTGTHKDESDDNGRVEIKGKGDRPSHRTRHASLSSRMLCCTRQTPSLLYSAVTSSAMSSSSTSGLGRRLPSSSLSQAKP